jgi:hypothetical protein
MKIFPNCGSPIAQQVGVIEIRILRSNTYLTMISFSPKTTFTKAARNFADDSFMEGRIRLSIRLMRGVLALGTAFETQSQVAFLGQGSIQGSVSPVGVDSVVNKGEFVPNSATPLGLAGTATALGDNYYSRGTVTGTYGAIATFGGLSGITSADADYPAAAPNAAYYNLGLSSRSNTRSITSITVSDLIFEGPTGTVSTRLNFLYSSAGNANLSFNPVGKGNANWGIQLSVQMPDIGGPISFSGLATGAYGGNQGVPGVANFAGASSNTDGLLSGYTSGTITLHTPFVEVPTGVPVSISISLDVSSFVGVEYGARGTAGVTANVGFPGGGLVSGVGTDVFDLRAGYTAKSSAWQLQANALGGGGGGGGAVPEPQEYAAVFGVGLLGFAIWRRRNRHVRSH